MKKSTENILDDSNPEVNIDKIKYVKQVVTSDYRTKS